MSLNASAAYVRLNSFQPYDLSLTAKGDPPGRSGCTASKSSSASKAPTAPPPGSPALATRARMIVHPALFWSIFDATNRICTESAIDLFSNATWIPPRKKVRQFRVR